MGFELSNFLNVTGIEVTGIEVTGIEVTGIEVTGIEVTGIEVTGIKVTGIKSFRLALTKPGQAPSQSVVPKCAREPVLVLSGVLSLRSRACLMERHYL
jgi:hypothetical protein